MATKNNSGNQKFTNLATGYSLAGGTTPKTLTVDTDFTISNALTSVTAHNVLSTTHGDTLADTVVRGDVMVGNLTPKWSRLAFPATPTGKVLIATATDVAWSANALGSAAYAATGDFLAAGGTAADSAKLGGALPAAYALVGQTMYIGTTGVAINRGSGALSLAGVNIDGSAGTVTGFSPTAGKTLTLSASATIATNAITLAGGEIITFSATNALTLATTAATSVTLPTTGTLVSSVTTGNGVSATNTAGALAFALGAITPTTVNALTLASAAVGFTVAGGTSSKTLTLDTDFTASTARLTTQSAFWTLAPGTPTRTANTTFTMTGDQTAIFAKGLIIKWTEAATIRVGMVSIPSTYGAPNTTVTIIGDTMASIDASSLKYSTVGAEAFMRHFAVAGTIGATGTDVANAYYATEPMRVIGADLQVGTAGTTNNTTVDINKGGTTMFTTKPTLATTIASSPTPFTADTTSALALGGKVTIDIDAVQTTAAIDIYVDLYLLPTRYVNLA